MIVRSNCLSIVLCVQMSSWSPSQITALQLHQWPSARSRRSVRVRHAHRGLLVFSCHCPPLILQASFSPFYYKAYMCIADKKSVDSLERLFSDQRDPSRQSPELLHLLSKRLCRMHPWNTCSLSIETSTALPWSFGHFAIARGRGIYIYLFFNCFTSALLVFAIAVLLPHFNA